jgi:hypothetical protein
LKYQVQIHQLTPNTIVQLSKYIWAITIFSGVPSADGFTKRYELHYQPRKVDVGGVEMHGQSSCINFHVKCESHQAKLTVAVKNKWPVAWPHAWFYCKVPLIRCLNPSRGKGVYALRSYMTDLCFMMDPPFDRSDEVSDTVFVKATRMTGRQDAVEENMSCRLLPLSASFEVGEVVDGETLVSRLSVPMSDFPIVVHPEEMNG